MVRTERPVKGRFQVAGDPRPTVGGDGFIRNAQPTYAPAPAEDHRMSHCADAATLGLLAYAGASIRGAFHEETKKHRQDAFAVGASDDRTWLIAVVADGVSEAPRSHIAAELACRYAVREFRSQLTGTSTLDKVDLARIADVCRAAIRKHGTPAVADSNDLSESDLDRVISKRIMATTLQFVVIRTSPDDRPEPAGHAFLTGALAGDGNSYILAPDKSWYIQVAGKDAGGIIENGVRAFPRDAGTPVVKTGALPHGHAIIITTDGIDIGDGRGALADYLGEQLSVPLRASSLLSVLDFVQIGASDDRSAVVVWT